VTHRLASLAATVFLLTILAPAAQAVMHPQMGRFLQRDPLGCVDGLALQEYVASNPVRFQDPSGMYLRDELIIQI
jgi:hypothetical protein